MFRAAVEGIGHSVRHNFDFMRGLNAKISEVVAVGGGTKNPIWLQATSDICKIDQQVPAITFGASYGDAFMAGLGVGAFKSAHDIKNWMKDIRTVKPNPATFEAYDKYHTVYKELYKRNADLMHEVYDMVG
jgi:xylulokinase